MVGKTIVKLPNFMVGAKSVKMGLVVLQEMAIVLINHFLLGHIGHT